MGPRRKLGNGGSRYHFGKTWIDPRKNGVGKHRSPHKTRQSWVPSTSFRSCVRGATRPNCQPLTLSHLEFGGGPTVSMPAAARPHCILAARNSETLTIFSNFERKHYVQVRRNYGRQPSNQLRGARGASAHACSTGLSTGRRLMSMTALCGAAAMCRGATTVRVAAHETSENEGDGCVDPDRGMSTSAFHTTSQRPACVAL